MPPIPETEIPPKSSEVKSVPSKSRKRRQAFVLTCASITIILNVVAVVIAIYSLVINISTKHPKGAVVSEDNVGTIACVTCNGKRYIPLLENLSKTVVNGTQLCCAESSEQMSNLMELVLTKPMVSQDGSTTDTSDNNLFSTEAANFSLSKASAHKALLPSKEFNSSKDFVPKFTGERVPLLMNNNYHNDITEHVREVEVYESGFKVIYPGLYYVYTNVRFKPDSSWPCRLFTYKTWDQIVRHKPVLTGQNKTILKTVHTCSDNSTSDNESSFTGGLFRLDAGDRLEVLTSGLGLTHFSNQSSFFGLVMLDSSDSRSTLIGQV
uniref:THD domain-containing protein n=1 Tax=Arion vulgaris TaxID=1028688 RepID=A0A0B7ACH2_9EUPU